MRRVGAVAVVVSAVIAAALVGGASTGRAATSFSITLSPLIGTAEVEGIIPQVSYGGKIGFHLVVTNSGDSTTQHASILVTSDLATFSDSDSESCVVNPKDAHQMICTPYGGTFVPNATFEVNLRFNAPASGEGAHVSTYASVSVAAQTVGGKKSNGTTIVKTDPPLLTDIVAGADKADTYLRANERAETGKLNAEHPHNFSLTLPAELFGAPFGVPLSIHDEEGTPICVTCLTWFTTLTIPVASDVTEPNNPFYDGTNANPYLWSMNAQYPAGFKLTGIYHLEEGATTADLVPSCADIGGGPTAADPMCWDTLVQNKNPKIIEATGRGLENGNIGYG